MKSVQQPLSLLKALRGNPSYVDLALERDKDLGRDTVNFENVKVKSERKKSLPK
jgi:hypothetical protein